MGHAGGIDHHALRIGAEGIGVAEAVNILIDLGATFDGGARLVIENHDRNGSGASLGLTFDGRVRPGINQVVVQAQVVVQVAREVANKGLANGRSRRAQVLPENGVGVVGSRKIERKARRAADVLVPTAHIAASAMAFSYLHRIARFQQGRAFRTIESGLGVAAEERRDEVRTEEGIRVDLVERIGLDGQGLHRVDACTAVDRGSGRVVVDTHGDCDRNALIGIGLGGLCGFVLD